MADDFEKWKKEFDENFAAIPESWWIEFEEKNAKAHREYWDQFPRPDFVKPDTYWVVAIGLYGKQENEYIVIYCGEDYATRCGDQEYIKYTWIQHWFNEVPMPSNLLPLDSAIKKVIARTAKVLVDDDGEVLAA